MMIDHVELSAQLRIRFQGTSIALQQLDSKLIDWDGSETLTLTIENLPVGAVLISGDQSFTATAGQTVADITDWYLGSAVDHAAADFYGTIPLLCGRRHGGWQRRYYEHYADTQRDGARTAVAADASPRPRRHAVLFKWSDFNASDPDGSSALYIDVDIAIGPAAGAAVQNSDGSCRMRPAPSQFRAPISRLPLRLLPRDKRVGYAGYGGDASAISSSITPRSLTCWTDSPRAT